MEENEKRIWELVKHALKKVGRRGVMCLYDENVGSRKGFPIRNDRTGGSQGEDRRKLNAEKLNKEGDAGGGSPSG